MRCIKFWLLIVSLTLLAGPPAAGQKKGTDDTSGHEPVTFTFRNCRDGFPSPSFAGINPEVAFQDHCATVANDRIQSDTGFPYVGGLEGVEAYVGTKGTAGNFWLKVPRSARSIFLDFSDCTSVSAECKPPFTSGEMGRASIYVQISAVRRNGGFGMAIGESLLVPMRIYFEMVAGQMNFVDFNPALGGKDPCKGKSNYIEVTRTGASTWVAYGDTIGCMSEQNGFGGTYRMPFRVIIEKQ